MGVSDLLYFIVIGFIRSVKWVELQFLKIFSTWIINKCIKVGEDLGVVFHLSEESFPNWSASEEKVALEKCRGKYHTLVHVRVHDPMCFVHLVNTGTWGHGEAFVDGMWNFCNNEGDVAHYTKRVLECNLIHLYFNWWNKFLHYLEFGMFNMQTRSRSWEVAEKHYDLGNDLYEAMLDPWMQYTCGYWANADNLNDAQLDKLELIAQKLKLKPGMRVLDLGWGWGMLCKYLAEKHGVHCVGVTISKEGAEYGRDVCKGLPVEIRHQDYRDMNEVQGFDRVTAIGIMEHIGAKNYETFFEVARRNLKDDGILLVHSIAENHKHAFKYDRWLCKHIFPGGSLPNARDITKVTEGLFVIEDWHNFSLDYAKTLNAWRDNFKKAWPSLRDSYDGRFYRMWIYYLSLCEGCFLSRKFQLWQIVLTKDGLKEGYKSVR